MNTRSKAEISGWSLRLKAQVIIRDYAEADQRYRALAEIMSALQERRTTLLEAIAGKARANEMTEEDMAQAVEELDEINEGFFDLTEPWNEANAAVKSKSDGARSFLRDSTHKSTSDEA